MPAPTTPIKRYAIETMLRDYALTSFKLNGGFEYSCILLFDTPEQAQASINEDIKHAIASRDEDGLDENDDDYVSDDEIIDDQGSVAEMLIHADGKIFNELGQDVAAYIGRSQDQTAQEVERHVAQFFKHTAKGTKKQHVPDSDGPQP
jgi:hypothetical protein